MKFKSVFFLSLFITMFFSVAAQKEVYFNTTKPEDIKVESMQGIEIGSFKNIENIFRPSNSYYSSTYIPITMGYFKEKRIAPSWTLSSRITLLHGFQNSPIFVTVKDSAQGVDSMYQNTYSKLDHHDFSYHLVITIGIEPRWYFRYKKRYQAGKARLNSGWFLSLPVTFSTGLINTYKPEEGDTDYANYKSYCSLGLSGVLGYRQAISKHVFLEGQLDLTSTSFYLDSYYKKLNFYQSTIRLLPNVSIKVAYTFK